MATSPNQLAKTGKFGDLRRRLIFLLLALVVYRIGAHIPVPGINPQQLQAKVRDSARRNPATEVQLRADQAVPFGRIAELIGLVQAGGLNRVGFVTETAAAPSAK